MTLKRTRSSSPPPPLQPSQPDKKPRQEQVAVAVAVAESAEIQDRRSRFIGYYHPTLSPHNLLQALTQQTKGASHRVQAWRKQRKGVLAHVPAMDQGFNDDGERHAGKKLLAVLEATDTTGSIVVARWYGGVMLGPVRFAHIDAVARAAIEAFGNEQQEARREAEAAELRDELVQRDTSIAALRQLLHAKKGSSPAESAKETTGPDYGSLGLERLRVLSKARDGTIAFLLKELDDADKASDNANDPS